MVSEMMETRSSSFYLPDPVHVPAAPEVPESVEEWMELLVTEHTSAESRQALQSALTDTLSVPPVKGCVRCVASRGLGIFLVLSPPFPSRHRWRNRNSGPTQRLWWIFRTQDPDTVARGQ